MASALPIPKHSAGRTFLVSMVVLGLLSIAQGAAVVWALLLRNGFSLSGRASVAAGGELQRTEEPSISAKPDSIGAFEFPDLPLTDARDSVPSFGPTPVPVVPLPPEPAGPPGFSPAQTRLAGLVTQARAVREAGDMSAALAKLREALALAPQDALVLSELAQTYERMGLREKATEYWQRVADQGEQAGALFDLAQIKLEAAGGDSSAGEVETGGFLTLRPGRDEQGLQPGSTLGLIDVRIEEDPDPAALRKLRLRLGLKARAGERVDPQAVVLQVFFYDLLDGQHIVQTNAEVGSEWTTAPVDWSDGGIEVLQVTYRQPKLMEPPAEIKNRRYLGYVVRVYFQSALQDMHADPPRLLTLYPPPLQLETDPPAP